MYLLSVRYHCQYYVYTNTCNIYTETYDSDPLLFIIYVVHVYMFCNVLPARVLFAIKIIYILF